VWDAAYNTDENLPYEHDIAVALRALADQVVPPALEQEFYERNPSLTLQKAVEIRQQILAIAAELEGSND
jgi:hypothetical protein